MLLQEIMKNTPRISHDYSDLSTAKKTMEEVAMEINETKRRAESAEELELLAPRFSPLIEGLVKPDRSILKFSPIEFCAPQSSKRIVQRRMFLLSDLLIIAKTERDLFGRETYNVHCLWWMRDLDLLKNSSLQPDELKSLSSELHNYEGSWTMLKSPNGLVFLLAENETEQLELERIFERSIDLQKSQSVRKTDVVKEGFMSKKGDGRFAGWKNRFFRLVPPYLYYFRQPNDVNPMGKINLKAVQSVEMLDRQNNKRFAFCIVTKDRTHAFSVATSDEYQEWTHTICAIVKP